MSFSKEKLAIAPLTWTNDDLPELGSENTFEQCVSEMALAGFRGCEIGGSFPKDPIRLREELEMRGLRVCNQWFSFTASRDDVEEIRPIFEEHLNFLRKVQDDIYIIGGGETADSAQGLPDAPVFQSKPIFDKDRWKKFSCGINELGKIANDKGFKLCFHTHMGTGVQTAEETERLLNDTNADFVSLNYDPGHFHYAGDDSVAVLEKFISRVAHVHLKDIRQGILDRVASENMSFLQSVKAGIFSIPSDSEGCIDFSSLFRILREAKYSHWLVVEAEQDPKLAAPFKTALQARAYLKEKLDL